MLTWRSSRLGSFAGPASPFFGRPRLRFGAFSAGAVRAGFSRASIAVASRDMCPTRRSLRLFNQRLVRAARQPAPSKFGEGARKCALAGNTGRALPPAQPAERPVDSQPLDQRRSRRQAENRLGDERTRQRVPIFKRTPRQARPCPHERLDASDLKHDHQPLVLCRERPCLFP